MFHNEGIVFMLQIYCSQYYHYYFYRVIFPSRSYFFWLGIPAWLLWTMNFWLLVDLSVIPGRQSSLNCCLPLERASLMGLLEFQSVSTVLFVSNISFLHPGSRDDATGCYDVGDTTQKAVAWKNESLSCLFQSVWCQAGIQQRWRLMSISAVLFFGCHLNNVCDEM